jgi:uncharacterized repeat protein (TIGR03803 family)
MQFLAHLRRTAALSPLALALGAGLRPAAAQEQQAISNAIPVFSFASNGNEENQVPPRNVRGSLLLAADGNIYMASTGGGKGTGSIARLTPEGNLSSVYVLASDGSDGISSWARLIQASDGHLYGTAFFGGEEGLGTLFRVTLSGEFALLHEFGGSRSDPDRPYTGVTEGPDGYLYGTTLYGGRERRGTIYRIAKDGTGFTVLHEFNGSDGENPEGDLVDGLDGYLYGTTMKGGASNRGTIYRLSTSGQHQVIYSFPGLGQFRNGVAINETGSDPRAGLTLGPDGYFYGTAYQGGEHGYGTVFRVSRDGELVVLHAFTGASFGGARPLAPVTLDDAGNLYGTTEYGGAMNQGSAWRLSPEGTFTLLHSFNVNAYGVNPYAGVLPAHGTLYAVSHYDYMDGYGRPMGSGTLIKIDAPEAAPPLLQVSASATEVLAGESFTVSWNGPAGWTCAKVGGSTGWAGEAAVSGSQTLTPEAATYTYGVRCTEPGEEGAVRETRLAQVAVIVRAPARSPIDGGGGAGSISMWGLLLAASLLFRKVLKERSSSCP